MHVVSVEEFYLIWTICLVKVCVQTCPVLAETVDPRVCNELLIDKVLVQQRLYDATSIANTLDLAQGHSQLEALSKPSGSVSSWRVIQMRSSSPSKFSGLLAGSLSWGPVRPQTQSLFVAESLDPSVRMRMDMAQTQKDRKSPQVAPHEEQTAPGMDGRCR